MSHLPRQPVNFLAANQELLSTQKSIPADSKTKFTTDYHGPTEAAFPVSREPQYRTPHDRVSGNEMFRRNVDGTLDYSYATHKVVDALHKVRDGAPLTGLDQCALSCLFPNLFTYVDASMAASTRAVNLKITLEESLKIARLVSKHLQHETVFMLSSHAR